MTIPRFITIKLDNINDTISIADFGDDESELLQTLVEMTFTDETINTTDTITDDCTIDNPLIEYRVYELKKYKSNEWNIK